MAKQGSFFYRYSEIIVLIIFSTFFLFILISTLNMPGVWNDEAHVAREAKDFFYSKIFFTIGYVHSTTVRSYLAIPFFILFGAKISSLRLLAVFVSLLTVWIIYYLCRAWFGKRVAFVTAGLTITNLAFIQYTKTSIFNADPIVVFFFWAGLLCLWKYTLTHRLPYLFFGFTLFGVALTTKITFLAYIMGMVVVYLIWRKSINSIAKLNFLSVSVGLFGFCAGAFFLIRYNLTNSFPTLRLLINSLVHSTPAGIDNLEFAVNFKTRMDQLYNLLSGKLEESFEWGIDASPVENVSFFIFILTILALTTVALYAFLTTGPMSSRKKILALCIFYSIVFLCSNFSVFSLRQEHLFLLFPFFQLAIALCFEFVYLWLRKTKIALVSCYAILFVFPVFFNTYLNLHYASEMKKNGGRGVWSTAIYDLVHYLREKQILHPICLFQEPAGSIKFLLNDPVESFYLEGTEYYFRFFGRLANTPDDVTRIAEIKNAIARTYIKYFHTNPDPFYIIAENSITADYLENKALEGFAKEHRKEIILEKTFNNKVNDPIYYLYELEDSAL